jgi:hypothetical protein
VLECRANVVFHRGGHLLISRYSSTGLLIVRPIMMDGILVEAGIVCSVGRSGQARAVSMHC